MNIEPSTPTYKRVRALTRGLDVLAELNRAGRASASELASLTGIDRATVYRLLHTLADYGVIAQSPGGDLWYLLRRVQDLAGGYTENDRILHVAARELGRLLSKVRWPSDFAIFDRGAMVIEETTHRFSPFSIHRNMVGRRRSLTQSALGMAALVGASDRDAAAMLSLAHSLENETLFDDGYVGRLREDFDRRGYCWSVGGSEYEFSAIALPVRTSAPVIGAVNIVFFRSASTPEMIAGDHLEHLRSCVASIEMDAS